MTDRENEISKSGEIEPTQCQSQSESAPGEAYREGVLRRQKKAFRLAMLIVAEVFLCVLVCGGIVAEDLHYRVTRQIENNLSGKNVFDTGEYVGQTDFGYFTGKGTFNYRSGSVYIGAWDGNHIHGLGTLNVPGEGTYKGDFFESQKSGSGVFTWNDGSVYDGEWKNDQMSGQGVYTTRDGVKYLGTFKENRFWQGSCEFANDTGAYVVKFKEYKIDSVDIVFPDGTRYNGSTDGSTLSGTGTMQFANGDQYTGHFVNGLRNGQGVYVWSNGDKYDGIWQSDAMCGRGTYTYVDGSYAQGEFDDGIFLEGRYKVVNSFGEYSFTIEEQEAVSVVMTLSTGTEYSGDMQNNRLTGSAQISYGNGDKYSGKVEDGRKTGEGTYTWSSGAWYEGAWSDDKMNGTGTYYYPEDKPGYKLTGSFVSGAPQGECWYYVSSSESYKTDWQNGKCVKIYE